MDKISKLIVLLLSGTLILQGAILYLDWNRKTVSKHSNQPGSVESAPANTIISTSGMPVLGQATTPLVVIEFSDFECPFCARHATTVFPILNRDWISTGKIQYMFANNPLSMHQNAKMLAAASICARQQNRYWHMHEALFSRRPRTKEDVLSLITSLGLDLEKFSKCVDSDTETSERISLDQKIAASLGLVGTPGFAVGELQPDKSLRVVKLIRGAEPIETFAETLSEVVKD